jgi:hypothetical protein
MNAEPSGRATPTGRSVMELLAEARPAGLDPGMDRARRASDLAVVLGTAGTVPGSAGGPERVDPPQQRPWTGGWTPHRRWLAFGSGLTLAAGVTAAAVTLSMFAATSATSRAPRAASDQPGQPGQPGRPGQQPAVLSARQILLTAAINAAKAPAAGRYWRVEDINGALSAAGPNGHPYAVDQRYSPEVTWDASAPDVRSWMLPSTGYTTSPATPGAAAAWRADGSPALPATHDKQQAWWQNGGGIGYFGNESPTFAQFQALPSNPAGLAAAASKVAEQQQKLAPVPGNDGHSIRVWQYGGPSPTLSQDMFGVYVQLLKWDPVTPRVRAAVFTDLSRLPGVRSVGQVTDPLGRVGSGIAMSSPNGAAGSEEVLVIDPGSGALLADEDVITTVPAGAASAASGAVPGPTSCPAATAVQWNGSCLSGARIVRVNGRNELRLDAGGTGVLRRVALGPRLALAPGQVEDYDVMVSAGWTNASPQLPPRSQQFSVVADGKG